MCKHYFQKKSSKSIEHVFSRHILKTIKSIEHVLSELQEFYHFSYHLKINLNIIVITVDFSLINTIHQLHSMTIKQLINLAGTDLKNNFNNLWKWQYTNYEDRKITIGLNSFL